MEKATAEVKAILDEESSEDGESSSEEEKEEEDDDEYTIQPSQDMTTWERVKVQAPQRETISDGSDDEEEENAVEPIKPVEKEREEEEEKEEKKKEEEEEEEESEVVPKKEVITITEKDVDEVMKPVEEKMKSTIFYYWPVMPQANFRRWEVKNAVM